MSYGLKMLHLIVAISMGASPSAPLTLQQALDNAHAHLPTLRMARAQSRAAEARGVAQRAGLLPHLDGSALYSRGTSSSARSGSEPLGATGASGGVYDALNAGLTLNQLIYDFGQTTGRWRAAQETATAQVELERAARLQAELTVRTAFFQARANKALMQVATENLANLLKHVGQAENFVQVGTKPQIDLVQAKSDHATGRVALITAENNYLIAKAELNQAMGIEMTTDYDVADDTMAALASEDASTDLLLQEALAMRPEFAEQQARLRAQEQVWRTAYGTYAPSLNATASVNEAGSRPSALGWGWNATLRLTWPLFSGFLTTAQIDEAEASLAELEAKGDGLHQQVRLDVERARVGVRAAKEGLDAAREALMYTQERLRLAEGRYEIGVGNIIELGDAQVKLTAAAAQAVQAEYSLAIARATLVKALARPM